MRAALACALLFAGCAPARGPESTQDEPAKAPPAESVEREPFEVSLPVLPRSAVPASVAYIYRGGYTSSPGPEAVLFALWPDGTLVWCDQYALQGVTYRADRATPEEVEALTRRLAVETLTAREPARNRHAPMHQSTATLVGVLDGVRFYEHVVFPDLRSLKDTFAERELDCDDGCEAAWNLIVPALAEMKHAHYGEPIPWEPIFRRVPLE